MSNPTTARNMAVVITSPIMNVIIESLIFDFDNNVRKTVLELINRILLTKDEKELRETISAYALRSDLDRYFVYGFGKHHFWAKQRKVSDPEQTFEQRMIFVKF